MSAEESGEELGPVGREDGDPRTTPEPARKQAACDPVAQLVDGTEGEAARTRLAAEIDEGRCLTIAAAIDGVALIVDRSPAGGPRQGGER